MSPRLKSGPRTDYGYLDAALRDLVAEARVAGQCFESGDTDSYAVSNAAIDRKRVAIIQRVRRIVRADQKRRPR